MEIRQQNKALVNSRQISRPVVLIQLSYQSKSTVSLLYLLRPQRRISAPHNASLCGATQRRNSTLATNWATVYVPKYAHHQISHTGKCIVLCYYFA